MGTPSVSDQASFLLKHLAQSPVTLTDRVIRAPIRHWRDRHRKVKHRRICLDHFGRQEPSIGLRITEPPSSSSVKQAQTSEVTRPVHHQQRLTHPQIPILFLSTYVLRPHSLAAATTSSASSEPNWPLTGIEKLRPRNPVPRGST